MADLHSELEKKLDGIMERHCIRHLPNGATESGRSRCYFAPVLEELQTVVREAADAALEHAAHMAGLAGRDVFAAALRREKTR